jgi:hypothetical protein
LEKLPSADERYSYIQQVMFESGPGMGRHGVLDVGEAVRLVHKKQEDRQKFFKFVDKYAQGLDLKGPFASLKDLV